MTLNRAIETRANEILQQFAVTDPGFDVIPLARACRATVELANLGEDVSGVLFSDGARAVIGVNWSHHPNRQRFTIAHELGHHLLHKGGTFIDRGIAVRFRDERSGSGTDEEEKQANAFAAALLMPADWIRRDFDEHPFNVEDEDALKQFADRYRVSPLAMSIRLQNLELIIPGL